MKRSKIIKTDKAPAAIGPYSQAISIENLVITAGQIALDPKTNNLIEGGIKTETKQVLENLRVIIEAAGSSLDRVIKTTVFLKDLNDFAAMNEIYGQYFSNNPPARSTVGVVALPKNAMVEIEALAYI